MKRLITFLLIVALASCQKELTEMKPAAVNDSAAITATPLVQIVSFKPQNIAGVVYVTPGKVRIFTLVLRVSGAPVEFQGFTTLFYFYSGVTIKHNVLRVDTTQFSHTRVRTWYSTEFDANMPGLKYDLSATPIKFGIGDHTITLKSDVEGAGEFLPIIEGVDFYLWNPQTQTRVRSTGWVNDPAATGLEGYISGMIFRVQPK